MVNPSIDGSSRGTPSKWSRLWNETFVNESIGVASFRVGTGYRYSNNEVPSHRCTTLVFPSAMSHTGYEGANRLALTGWQPAGRHR